MLTNPPNPQRVAQRFLSAALDSATSAKIAQALIKAGLDGSKSFKSLILALTTVERVLSTHGVEWGTKVSVNTFQGERGSKTLPLVLVGASPPVSKLGVDWFQTPTGYEVVAYLT